MNAIGDCVECGYPIGMVTVGQQVSCPHCQTINEVSSLSGTISEIKVPTPLFAGLIGLAIGIIIGPALIASTSGGARWLEKKARERLP